MYRIPLALVALALLILGVFILTEKKSPVEEPLGPGILFTVPDGYARTDEVTTGRYSVRLVRKEDVVSPENGEGPSGIAVDMHVSELTLVEWMTTTEDSNFGLGDQTYSSTTIAGIPAVRYRWSGLYEGETTAFLHRGSVVAISVTRLSAGEHTEAYEKVLSSLQLK